MIGINCTNGKRLDGLQHLRQSVRDILTTRIGTRVMRRDYGSRVMQLIDAPMNNSTLIDIYSAVSEALAAWEPRLKLSSVRAVSAEPGRLVLDIAGEYLPEGKPVLIDGVVVK